MRLEGKRKLVVLLIGFFIALGFTILAIRKGIELISVEQDLKVYWRTHPPRALTHYGFHFTSSCSCSVSFGSDYPDSK